MSRTPVHLIPDSGWAWIERKISEKELATLYERLRRSEDDGQYN